MVKYRKLDWIDQSIRIAILVGYAAVLYVVGMVETQKVDSQSSRRAVNGASDRLGGEGERTRQDNSGGRGFRARTATDRLATSPPDGCPIEAICKDGNCNKNYLVFLTADWCVPCRRMHPVIDELAKDYIVYTIRVEDQPEVFARLAATGLPTTIVFDQGKEVTRYVGLTSKDALTNRLKTRKEQASAPDYDFR